MPKKKAKRRLKQLRVGEISLVDKPAVGERFLIAKRFDGDGADESEEDEVTAETFLNKTFWLTKYIEVKGELEALKQKGS